MAIRVVIDREVKKGKRDLAVEIVRQLRAMAMKHPGYISGETLVSNRNPNHIVVISSWDNIGNWLDWTENEKRNALEQELQEHLSGPARYEEFSVGVL